MNKTKSELIIRAINKNSSVTLVRNMKAKIIRFPVFPRINFFSIA